MSKSHRLAWAAGFIDGDGFITIQTRTQMEKESYYLRVGACQATKTPLEELQRLLGGSIRPKNAGPNREGYKRKPQWIWTLSTNEAKEALQQLLPFLIHKRQVALLALEFQNTIQANKTLVSEEVNGHRRNIKIAISAANALS